MKRIIACAFLAIILSNLNVLAQERDNYTIGESNIWGKGFLRDSVGIDINVNYKGDLFSNSFGGNRREITYLDNVSLNLNLNLDKLNGWKNATFYTSILVINGGDPAENAGAAQGISSIAAYNTWKIYECWFQQKYFRDKFSVLAGLYDLNSEFDVRKTSSVFINPSQGIGPEYAMTGRNGPSIFPNTSLALRLEYNFSSFFNIKTAVFDGVPGDVHNPNGTHVKLDKNDGLLLSSEITFKSKSEELDENYFRYSLGGWYYTGKFQKIATTISNALPEYQRGNYGMYFSAEKLLITNCTLASGDLAGFLRVGFANSSVNDVNGYFGAGLTCTGFFPGRKNDVFGISLASMHYNQKYIDIINSGNRDVKRFEHIIEVTYLFNLSNWLRIQPDMQYVINPANCINNNFALLFGTRLEVNL